MKTSIIAMSVAALLAFGTASAATPAASAAGSAAKPMTAQQQRMADCSKQNKGKKGEEYKSAQKACLSGKSAPAAAAAPMAAAPMAAAPMTQQERMKSCNADAGKQALKGDARKTFMSGCLKKK